MGEIGETVDHRHAGMAGELGEVLGTVGTQQDGVHVAGEDARRIGDRLAAAELHVLAREHDRLPAELAHGDLETDPGAGARLFENHGERPSGERLVGARRQALARLLEALRGLKHGAQRRSVEIADLEEVTRRRRAGLGRGGRRDGGAHAAPPLLSAERRAAAARIMRSASLISASEMMSGGVRRTTFSPALMTRSPSSISACCTFS